MKKQRLKPQVQYLILLAGITVICLIIRYCFPVGYDLDSLKNYVKTKHAEEIPVCASSSIKTYEDYRMITDETSDQYRLIHTVMKKDRVTGLLYDPDGFIGVALGYQFGPVGTRYYFDLDTGITLPVIKIDAKDPADASDGCKVDINGSVLEFVIDSRRAAKYFGTASNGLVLQGNFNSHPSFEGNIAHIERITEEQE